MVLGVGMDIQGIKRMELALKRGGERFLQRTFTTQEVDYCQKQAKPSQHFCGRFCAKEAFFKALGTGWAKGVKFSEVEIARAVSGKPLLHLNGQTKSIAKKHGIKKIWLSLSHSKDYAAATVILEG
jgi:holo-[acyl-carrier protein] synthase